MKKFVAIAVSIIMVFSVLALTACGGGGSSEDLSDSKYVGTWKGVEMTVADESEEFQDDIILTINGDGTGTLVGSEEGETEESSFTWEPTSDGFKPKGDVKMTFKDDGDKITSKIIGVTMVFEKQ
jgi:uncharacterized lipoprotein YehR (DUF1307 family)